MAHLTLSSFTLLILCLQAQYLCAVKGEENALTFFALGDWGGVPMEQFDYSTKVERAVANSMGERAKTLKPSFIISLGDNFYFTGVDDVEDERFFGTFENIFSAPSLKGVPWQVCAGNHDHYGNVLAEIAYTEKSDRWSFPNYYHTKSWPIPGTDGSTLQLVLIDTIVLCGASASDSSEDQPGEPDDPEFAAVHWDWIERTLNSSTADYLLVGGHYPVWSAGMHGPTKCLLDKLKEMLEKYQVTAYLAGHDHNNQHIDEGTGVQYYITGCATFVQSFWYHESDVPEESLKFSWANRTMGGGYMSFSANPTELTATYVSGTGEEVYQTTAKPRKNLLY